MHFDMFEKFGPSFFRTKPKTRPSMTGMAPLGRRPLPTEGVYPCVPPTEITSLRQTSSEQENRPFRALDRHARWQVAHELTHGRATQ
jgi:hypothetical protein